MFTRRHFLSTGGTVTALGLAGAPAILKAQSWFLDYPFKLGVASGDPAPDGFASAPVQPPQAFFSPEFGEFLLPYEAVRTAADPEATLMAFLQSTYDAAAALGKWDRDALECPVGAPSRPRPL